MKKLLLFLLLLPALAGAQLSTAKKWITNKQGKQVPAITYTLGTDTLPLIVFLHGKGEYGDGTETGLNKLLNSTNHKGLLDNAPTYKYHMIAPQFVQAYNYDYDKNGNIYNTWQPDWVGGYYLKDIIEWAKKNMPVDPTRIYLTGLSSGGSGTWDYIIRDSVFTSDIAAAVPVCSGDQQGDYSLPVKQHVAVWAFHGTADPSTPYASSVNNIKKLNDQGIDPAAKLTSYQGAGHSIWGTAYGTKELYTWMLQQKRKGTAPPVVVPPTPPAPPAASRVIIGRVFIAGWEFVLYDDGTAEGRK